MKRFFSLSAFLAAAIAALSFAQHTDGQVLRRKAVTVTKTETLTQPAPAAAAQADATAKTTGPVFNAVLRAKVRQELRSKHGYSLAESIKKANELTDENIKGLIADAETLSGVKVVGTAIGDGKIIGAIIDFFNSPAGKMLLEMLMKLLLGALIHHDDPAGMWHTSLQAWNA